MLRMKYVFILLLITSTNLLAQNTSSCTSTEAFYDLITNPESRTQWYSKAVSENPVHFFMINNWNE